MSLSSVARTAAAMVRRRIRPTPEEAAWRAIRLQADRQPRLTPGVLRLIDLDIAYVDALSLAPQWHDIFMRRTLQFHAATDTPYFLDCGANIGLASIWFKRQYPRARVTAFEADPQISQVLRRNLDRNGMSDVDVVSAAVWRENTRLAFRAEGSDSGSIDAVAARTPGKIVEVPAIRLRDRLLEQPVDLLKLDIEGAELEVLEDAADALSQVKALVVEVHDFDPARRLLPRCLMTLERAGFAYTLGEFSAATWRSEAAGAGPFAAVPAWVIAVRAWRA